MANFNHGKTSASLNGSFEYPSVRVEPTKIPKSLRMWRLLNVVSSAGVLLKATCQRTSLGVKVWAEYVKYQAVK